MKYSVTGSKVWYADLNDIEAETPHEALNVFCERNPGFSPDAVEEMTDCGKAFEYVGKCEDCEAPLLSGVDDYVTDPESGIVICRACCDRNEQALRERVG
jgi:hypothetical protein